MLVLPSCDKTPKEPAISCQDLEKFIQDFDQKHDDAIDISSFELDDQDHYQFHFFDGSTISLHKDCIDLVNENKADWILEIYFKNTPQTRLYNYLGSPEIQILVNPDPWNPLSAKLFIKTPRPVRLGYKVKGPSPFQFAYTESGLDQELQILGLYPSTANQVEVHVLDANESILFIDTISIQTDDLDIDISERKIRIADKSQMEEGFTLVSSRNHNSPNIPYMIDAEGVVRWLLDFRSHPILSDLGYDVGIEQLKNGNLYFGDWTTDAIYEIDFVGNILHSWDLKGYDFHHNVVEKPNGNFLVTVSDFNSVHLNGNGTVEDVILELDRSSGDIINIWDLKESLDENRTSLIDNLNYNPVDWAHTNAVIFDPIDDGIIVSCRTQGLVKLSEANEVQWILSPHDGWSSNRMGQDLNDFLLQPLDANGIKITNESILQGQENHVDFEWNWYQHAPELHPDGSLYLFDNGGLNRNFGNAALYSRAVGYTIDAQEKTIQQIWQYGKERGLACYSSFLSDVDILANSNNLLFAPGASVQHEDGTTGAKIIEIDTDTKTVVFEAWIIGNGGQLHRAERMKLIP